MSPALFSPFREVSPGAMLVAVAAEPESATEASDAELAGRVRGGDRVAEAELFRRLAPRVRLYGLRHLRDPAAADDLVQDVLLMTFDSLRAGKVREDERLASYVLGTCRRMARARPFLERCPLSVPLRTIGRSCGGCWTMRAAATRRWCC